PVGAEEGVAIANTAEEAATACDGAVVECFVTALLLANPGRPFTGNSGSTITEKGSSSRAAMVKVRTMCRVAAERFFRMNAAPEARASRTVAFKIVSRIIAEIGVAVGIGFISLPAVLS